VSHGIYTTFSQAERSALEEDLEDLEKKMAALAFPKQKAQEWQWQLSRKVELWKSVGGF